jgi:very-short-patch-repair endonuclease
MVDPTMSKDLRRKLGVQPTIAERALWQLLWPWRTGGYHFRKQVELGAYYVDFACVHAQLVIEVDGESHGGAIAQANDQTRDEYLAARGFTVLRFSNGDVLKNADSVFQTIAAVLAHRPARLRGAPPPQPSPQGGGCDPVVASPSRLA